MTEIVTEGPQPTEAATTPDPLGRFTAPIWSKSSLSFDDSFGCQGDCRQATAKVCNTGSGDMSGTVAYKVYYQESGNPKFGSIVDSGTVGPLNIGECQVLTYSPVQEGNYMFKAFQETGHPGTGELWSGQCSIQDCEISQTPPPDCELSVSYGGCYLPDSVANSLSVSDQDQWLINNPSFTDVNYTYSSDNGDNGSGVAHPGSNTLYLPVGATKLTLYWGRGKSTSADLDESTSCQLPQPEYSLSLDKAGPICEYDPQAIPFTVTVSISNLPEGENASLNICTYEKSPNDNSASPDCQIFDVSNGNDQLFNLDLSWPGIQEGDTSVEVVVEATLTGPGTEPIQQSTSLTWDSSNENCPAPQPLKFTFTSLPSAGYCEWKPVSAEDFGTTFAVDIQNLGTQSAVLHTSFEEVTPLPSVPVVTDTVLSEGLNNVSISGSWPGAYPGNITVEVKWTAELWIDGELKDTKIVTKIYDPETMRESCEFPEPQKLILLDPYCKLVEGESGAQWNLAWEIQNPNPWVVDYSLVLDSGTAASATIEASSNQFLFTTSLDAHQVDLSWYLGDAKQTISLTNSSIVCEQPGPTPTNPATPTEPANPPQEPNPPAPPVVNASIPVIVNQPQPTLSAPVAEGVLLIPVTGTELESPLVQLVKTLKGIFLNLGFLFLGAAFVFTGLGRKLY